MRNQSIFQAIDQSMAGNTNRPPKRGTEASLLETAQRLCNLGGGSQQPATDYTTLHFYKYSFPALGPSDNLSPFGAALSSFCWRRRVVTPAHERRWAISQAGILAGRPRTCSGGAELVACFTQNTHIRFSE